VNTDSIFKTYSERCRIRILLYLADDLKNIPEVDKIQVLLSQTYIHTYMMHCCSVSVA
jgi:hypothetical protein